MATTQLRAQLRRRCSHSLEHVDEIPSTADPTRLAIYCQFTTTSHRSKTTGKICLSGPLIRDCEVSRAVHFSPFSKTSSLSTRQRLAALSSERRERCLGRLGSGWTPAARVHTDASSETRDAPTAAPCAPRLCARYSARAASSAWPRAAAIAASPAAFCRGLASRASARVNVTDESAAGQQQRACLESTGSPHSPPGQASQRAAGLEPLACPCTPPLAESRCDAGGPGIALHSTAQHSSGW